MFLPREKLANLDKYFKQPFWPTVEIIVLTKTFLFGCEAQRNSQAVAQTPLRSTACYPEVIRWTGDELNGKPWYFCFERLTALSRLRRMKSWQIDLPMWLWCNQQPFVNTTNSVIYSRWLKTKVYHRIKCLNTSYWRLNTWFYDNRESILLFPFLIEATLVNHRGFEPRTPWLKVRCSTNWANDSYHTTTCLLYHTFN